KAAPGGGASIGAGADLKPGGEAVASVATDLEKLRQPLYVPPGGVEWYGRVKDVLDACSAQQPADCSVYLMAKDRRKPFLTRPPMHEVADQFWLQVHVGQGAGPVSKKNAGATNRDETLGTYSCRPLANPAGAAKGAADLVFSFTGQAPVEARCLGPWAPLELLHRHKLRGGQIVNVIPTERDPKLDDE